ncbi:MAG: hypothetical protein Q9217_003632 [Psora testacea]
MVAEANEVAQLEEDGILVSLAHKPLDLSSIVASTMLCIAKNIKDKHSLTAISIIHRLGVCLVGEESILIAVSAPHRQAAWKGGEEALENCKEKVEIWKMEEFGGDEAGVWRANRDGAAGVEDDENGIARRG